MSDWKPDYNKLKNYKIEESKFENPDFKKFTDCILSNKDKENVLEEDINRCGSYLPPSHKVESGGDMRCSGKSEILHLILPRLKYSVKFGMEEGRGPISSKLEEFGDPDINKLAIYVKRNPEEKLKCLLRNRSIFKDDIEGGPYYYDPLPNALRDESYNDVNNMRKTMLPSIHKQKNFIILENQNKEEEPVVTNEKICELSKIQLKQLKKNVKGFFESDKMFVESGHKEIILTRGKSNYEAFKANTEKTLEYNKEYENICNTSKDMSKIKNIMEKIKILRQ